MLSGALRSPGLCKLLRYTSPSQLPSSPLISRIFLSSTGESNGPLEKEFVQRIEEGEKSSSNSNSVQIQKLSNLFSGTQRSARNQKFDMNPKHKKHRSLHSLLAKPPKRRVKSAASKIEKSTSSVELESLVEKEVSNPKELSPEMTLFVNYLQEKGYLSKANFLQEGQLDADRFSGSYAQGLLKYAAERFGCDHQDIAKWLSGSHLKKVTLLGCPSVEKRTVFAAKNLRSFFSIEEDTVCQPCKLKNSCKFRNERVDKTEKLDLVDVLRVLTAFSSNYGLRQLPLSDEIEASINKLLKEVVSLSK